MHPCDIYFMNGTKYLIYNGLPPTIQEKSLNRVILEKLNIGTQRSDSGNVKNALVIMRSTLLSLHPLT